MRIKNGGFYRRNSTVTVNRNPQEGDLVRVEEVTRKFGIGPATQVNVRKLPTGRFASGIYSEETDPYGKEILAPQPDKGSKFILVAKQFRKEFDRA